MKTSLLGRIPAAYRDHSLKSLKKDASCVPRPEMMDLPPTGKYRLASHYLLDDSRLKRRETTVDVYLSEVGTRTIDVECSIPNFGWREETWYLPLAFFPKDEVAPDLEVVDCDGQVVAIPTKEQNIGLTERAVDELIDGGRLKIDPKPLAAELERDVSEEDVREFLAEIISDKQLFARARRLLLEEMPDHSSEVIALMRRLEDSFVLWVPAAGRPQSHHHFRIRRREIKLQDPIIAPKKIETYWVDETALGPLNVDALSAEGPPWPRWKTLFDRLPNTLAVRPLEQSAVDSEAWRADSCHMRVNAPPGFLVRNIRAGQVVLEEPESGYPPSTYPEVVELDPREKGVVIQGWDQNLAHLHLFKEKNPEEVYCLVTLGPRGGAISLWMVAAVLTALLLWIVHHAYVFGPSLQPGHFELVAASLSGRETGDAHLPITSADRQILAAVLLVGPAFASAWSLRAEGGELLRSFFAGARFLLLASAGISVMAAMALIGLPWSDSYTAIELYAAASYLIATPLVGAWLLSRDSLWVLFRFAFNRQRYNVLAVGILALAVIAAGAFDTIPDGCTGLIVVVSGLALALIGANSAGQPLRLDRRHRARATFYRTVAGFGSIPIIVLAGSFLGFYGDRLASSDARIGCVIAGSLVASAAISWVFFALIKKKGMKGN